MDSQDVKDQASDQFDVDWTNMPNIMDIKADVEAAGSYHQEGVNRVQHYRKIRENNFKSPRNQNKKVKQYSEFAPKVVKGANEWRIPSLSEPFLSMPDLFKLKPRGANDVEKAVNAALLINYQMNNEINKVNLVDSITRKLVEDGTVITRTGWKSVEIVRPVKVKEYEYRPPANEQEQQNLATALRRYKQAPIILDKLPEDLKQSVLATEEADTPLIAELIEERTEDETVVLENRPDVTVCSIDDVIIDPSCKGNLKEAKFIAYRYKTSRSDLKASGLDYKNLDKLQGDNSHNSTTVEYSGDVIQETGDDFNFKDEARKEIEVIEYWGYLDVYGNGTVHPVVIEYVGSTIIRMATNPYSHNSHPFDICHYVTDVDSAYGEADAEIVKEDQEIIGALSRGMIDIVGKQAVGQKGMPKGLLDTTNAERHRRGMDYFYNPGLDPRASIFQENYTDIPVTAFNMLDIHRNSADSLSGIKAFHNGISGDALGSTVGGIRSATDAAGKREKAILRRLAELYKSIGKKIVSMNGQFLDEATTLEVTEGNYVEITSNDVHGAFDLVLDISSVEEDAERTNKLSFVLQTLGNNFPLELSQTVLAEIADLMKMPRLHKQISEYKPQPDPLEEAMKQLEVKSKEVEIMVKEAEAKERLAKAEKALADARKASSEADLNDLDFVEQESGVKQERDKELQSQQALGNIALEQQKQRANTQTRVDS